jgi:hypothetical protein
MAAHLLRMRGVRASRRGGRTAQRIVRHHSGGAVLHPNQFEVNEAWIAFRLNNAPVRTQQDGDFNCIALMDAASCYILGTQFVPVQDAEPSTLHSRELLIAGRAHKRQLPKTLFLAAEELADALAREARRQKVEVVRVAEMDLLPFIGEARSSFAERFED